MFIILIVINRAYRKMRMFYCGETVLIIFIFISFHDAILQM